MSERAAPTAEVCTQGNDARSPTSAAAARKPSGGTRSGRPKQTMASDLARLSGSTRAS